MLAEGIIRVHPPRYSIPCCCLSRSRFSCLSWISSFERTIFSGWWYNTKEGGPVVRIPSIVRKARLAAASGATHTDQVSALEVEAIELIACLLGVVYVLVDDECCTLGVVGNALTDLAGE